MKTMTKDFWTVLGVRKQEELFFKVYPERIQTVTDVKMMKVTCPGCEEETRDAWVYFEGENEFVEEVVPRCINCEKDEYAKTVTKQLREKHTRILEKEWYQMAETETAGFKNFDVHNVETKVAKMKALDYLTALREGKKGNLLLAGTPGTGKTHLAKAIARTFKFDGRKVAFIPSMMLFDHVKKTFGNEVVRKRFDEQFQAFDLVVIDDVGLETRKISDVSWTSSEWVRLIEQRKGKSTVYTTNFEPSALAEVIGARAESRMCEQTMLIDLFTPEADYRRGTLFY